MHELDGFAAPEWHYHLVFLLFHVNGFYQSLSLLFFTISCISLEYKLIVAPPFLPTLLPVTVKTAVDQISIKLVSFHYFLQFYIKQKELVHQCRTMEKLWKWCMKNASVHNCSTGLYLWAVSSLIFYFSICYIVLKTLFLNTSRTTVTAQNAL